MDNKKSKKIRLLLITPDSQICGTEQRIYSLLRNINRDKFALGLVTCFGPGDLVEAARNLGIPAMNLRMKEDSIVAGLRRWKGFVAEFNPHVLQSLLFYSNLLARMTRFFMRDVAVLSGISTVYSSREYGHFYAWGERLTHRLDSLYVANSMVGRNEAMRAFRIPDAKLAVVHNGIEITHESEKEYHKIRDEIREDFGYERHHLVVGMTAQLRPAKRHDLLIEAAAQLKPKFPTLRLLLIGGGEPLERLTQLAHAKGVGAETCFTGYRADARRLLHAMDLFALPSDVEGEPVSVLEAMDAMLPVVSTRTGGIPDLVQAEHTGLLSEPGQLDPFIRNLDRLLDSSVLRQTMGEAGRQRVITHFSAERMTQEFQRLYEACFAMRQIKLE